MTYLFIIAMMAILAMASGGSLPGSHLLNDIDARNDDGSDKGGVMPFNLSWLPEALFAAVIATCSVEGIENLGADWSFTWMLAAWVLMAGWSYTWMQTGHAAVLPWDRIDKLQTKPRNNTLTMPVQKLCRLLHIRYERNGNYTEAYVWMFAGVKGFLMGLPVGGVVTALLWPLGYEIGSHAKNRFMDQVSWDMHMVSEGNSGAGVGIGCVCWLMFTAWVGG